MIDQPDAVDVKDEMVLVVDMMDMMIPMMLSMMTTTRAMVFPPPGGKFPRQKSAADCILSLSHFHPQTVTEK